MNSCVYMGQYFAGSLYFWYFQYETKKISYKNYLLVNVHVHRQQMVLQRDGKTTALPERVTEETDISQKPWSSRGSMQLLSQDINFSPPIQNFVILGFGSMDKLFALSYVGTLCSDCYSYLNQPLVLSIFLATLGPNEQFFITIVLH